MKNTSKMLSIKTVALPLSVLTVKSSLRVISQTRSCYDMNTNAMMRKSHMTGSRTVQTTGSIPYTVLSISPLWKEKTKVTEIHDWHVNQKNARTESKCISIISIFSFWKASFLNKTKFW